MSIFVHGEEEARFLGGHIWADGWNGMGWPGPARAGLDWVLTFAFGVGMPLHCGLHCATRIHVHALPDIFGLAAATWIRIHEMITGGVGGGAGGARVGGPGEGERMWPAKRVALNIINLELFPGKLTTMDGEGAMQLELESESESETEACCMVQWEGAPYQLEMEMELELKPRLPENSGS